MLALVTDDPRDARELDDVTLARAKTHDAKAFRVLIETYQDAVFALLARFLGRHAQAAVIEDLAQETFVGVYRSLPRFEARGAAKLSTWILTIAARTALKERRRPASNARTVNAMTEPLVSPARTDQRIEQRAVGDAIARALANLGEPYRVVFLLREYHDFDYREIATALEIDLGTVKSRLARAREQLRTALKELAP
ncbi:MAG: RNA polymerase sigma factor [Kofleriaceae bacterium]